LMSENGERDVLLQPDESLRFRTGQMRMARRGGGSIASFAARGSVRMHGDVGGGPEAYPREKT
jgi:hypothetical protein